MAPESQKVGIYIEMSRHGVTGGAQTHAAVLAEWLSYGHEVELLVRAEPFDLIELGAVSRTDLSRVRLRLLPQAPSEPVHSIPWHYDLFIAFVHKLPPECPAARGVLMNLFPWHAKCDYWPWSESSSVVEGWQKRLCRPYHEWRWRQLLDQYQVHIANSRFTQAWITQRWGVESTVVYPPVMMPQRDPRIPCQDVILSVGRFTPSANSKCQRDLLLAFESLVNGGRVGRNWQYWSIGGVSDHVEDQAYFDDCRAIACRSGAHVESNVPAAGLERKLWEAAIFWHGAGYGVDELTYPQHLEHFGMATVEAMAHGCVPIVIRRGGQPEIVQEGWNGLLWETLDELIDATVRCIVDPVFRVQLARQAKIDSQKYSREAFIRTMSALMAKHFNTVPKDYE